MIEYKYYWSLTKYRSYMLISSNSSSKALPMSEGMTGQDSNYPNLKNSIEKLNPSKKYFKIL